MYTYKIGFSTLLEATTDHRLFLVLSVLLDGMTVTLTRTSIKHMMTIIDRYILK